MIDISKGNNFQGLFEQLGVLGLSFRFFYLCFRVFKPQLKVINKNVCYLYSAEVNQIKVALPLVTLYLFQNFYRSIEDRVKIKYQLRSTRLHNL